MLFLFIIFLIFTIAMIYEFIGNHLSTPEDRRHTFKVILSIIIRVLIVLISPSVIIIASGSLPSVMTWILSDGHEPIVITAPLMICLLEVMILTAPYDNNRSSSNDSSKMTIPKRIYVYPILSFVFLIISFFISTHYESENDWKTVYANEIDANVEISFQTSILEDVFSRRDDHHYSETISPESEIDYKTYVLNKSRYGTLKVKKNNTTETREIYFDKNNLKGELAKQSKITKIEYRNITSLRRTLFGFKGKSKQTSKLDGEVRITVEDNPQRQELKNLLDN